MDIRRFNLLKKPSGLRPSLSVGLLAMIVLALPALALAEDYMRTGSYTGDGTNSHSITGLGFTPDMVIVKAGISRHSSIKTTGMEAGKSKRLADDRPLDPDRIISLDADGFTLGNHDSTNMNGEQYYWVAMKSVSGSVTVGQYVGDGSSNRTVSVPGVSPDAVIVLPKDLDFPVYRHQDMDLYEGYRLDGGGLVHEQSRWCERYY